MRILFRVNQIAKCCNRKLQFFGSKLSHLLAVPLQTSEYSSKYFEAASWMRKTLNIQHYYSMLRIVPGQYHDKGLVNAHNTAGSTVSMSETASLSQEHDNHFQTYGHYSPQSNPHGINRWKPHDVDLYIGRTRSILKFCLHKPGRRSLPALLRFHVDLFALLCGGMRTTLAETEISVPHFEHPKWALLIWTLRLRRTLAVQNGHDPKFGAVQKHDGIYLHTVCLSRTVWPRIHLY